jgi:hypothetical protein
MKTADKPIKQVKPPSTYVTGFCNDGNHVGTNNLSPSGVLMPACRYIYNLPRISRIECMCWCHDIEREFQAMFAAAGKVQVSDSVPVSVLAAPSLRATPTVDDEAASAPVVMTPFGTRPPINVLRGGRVARGQLEQLIYEVITDPTVGIHPASHEGARYGLTPKFIANEIRIRTVGAYEPSVGAIHSALTKWSVKMLITVVEKPLQVVAVSDRLRQEYR